MNEEQQKALNKCIKKASKSWQFLDVDEFLQDIRGEQPIFLGKDLIFISRIHSSGKCISEVSKEVSKNVAEIYKNDEFTLVPLSISLKTYIAFGMSVFVVKIRE